MKTRAGYVIRQLADTFYIIPTGQRIADRRRCLKINQTGCVIWDLLQKDLSWEELLSAYTEYVKSIEMTEGTKTVKPASIGEEASTVTAASISSDLSTYVLTLFQFGMIQASAKEMQAFPFASASAFLAISFKSLSASIVNVYSPSDLTATLSVATSV